MHVSCTLHPDLSSVDSRSATPQSSTIFPPGEHLSLGDPSASGVGDSVSMSRDCAEGGDARGGLQSVMQRAASFSVRESSRQKLFEFGRRRAGGALRGTRFLVFEYRSNSFIYRCEGLMLCDNLIMSVTVSRRHGVLALRRIAASCCPACCSFRNACLYCHIKEAEHALPLHPASGPPAAAYRYLQ